VVAGVMTVAGVRAVGVARVEGVAGVTEVPAVATVPPVAAMPVASMSAQAVRQPADRHGHETSGSSGERNSVEIHPKTVSPGAKGGQTTRGADCTLAPSETGLHLTRHVRPPA
jgi:hypothetical protein